MIDQYKKETSQIHAPADLVQKTKLAMQQEEQRLRETAGGRDRSDTVVREQSSTADKVKKSPRPMHRVYQWTLPLTAAAAVVILLSVSMVMRGTGFKSSDSDRMADSGYGKDMGLQFGGTDMTEEAMEENEAPVAGSPVKPIRQDVTEDYDMAEEAEGTEPEEDIQTDEAADTQSDASESIMDRDETPETNGAAVKGEAAEEIEITEVKEEPDFYNSEDTESYLYKNLIFWVNQEENGEWFAYVSVRGDKYVIVSTIKDQDEFIEKAYELVEETRGTLK